MKRAEPRYTILFPIIREITRLRTPVKAETIRGTAVSAETLVYVIFILLAMLLWTVTRTVFSTPAIATENKIPKRLISFFHVGQF